MYKFSGKSRRRLKTCHRSLQLVFAHVIKNYDCTILEGYRDKGTQNGYYRQGKSKLKYPQSKHNKRPSLGIDVVPYIAGKGIVWDAKQCYHFAGYVMGVASMLGVELRSGADWDQDTDINDQSFLDLVHFELVE